MLAALADELGPARFGELWRGPASLADGYAALTGQPLTSWVASYVAERTLPYHAGPGLRVLPALLGVVLSLLALGLTLRFAPRRMT